MLRPIYISSRARTLIVLLLAILFLSISAFSLITTRSWINRPFPGFLVMSNNYVAVIWLPDWEGFNQGIKFRDIVTAVNGKPISSGDELNRLVASTGPGTPLTYTIIRGKRELNLTIPVTVFSPQDYFFIFYFSMLIGLLFYGTGLVVFALRPNLSASRAFLFFSVIFGTYLVASPEFFTNHVNSLPLIALPLLGPSILVLSLYFPEKNKWSRYFMAFILLTAVPLVVLNNYFFQDVQTFSFINRFHIANIFIAAILGTFLVSHTFRSSDELIREKIKIVFYGSLIAFLGVVGVIIGTIILGKISFFWSLPFLVVLPLSFGYAITMGDLFDVELFDIIRHSLAFKLFAFLLIIGILVFLPMTVLILLENRRNLEYQILSSVRQTNNLIINTTRYSMLKNDRKAIDKTMLSLKKIPEIDLLRIYSKKGISFSTLKEDIGQEVDKKAEQCIVCHGVEPALEVIPEGKSLQIFTYPDGHRYVTKIVPILNSRACGLTDCHPKPSEQKVLGILETRMSLAEVDSKIAASRNHMIELSILAIIIIELFAAVFIWFFVHKRVQLLTEGSLKVGGGDLDHQVDIWGEDELASLAQSFNDMVVKVRGMVELEASYRELKEIDEMKDNLLHMVSHDLRTPMTSILGYAYVLHDRMESLDNETQKDYLSIMVKEGERLTRLISDLLDLQRFEAGRMELEFEDLDIIELVRDSLQVFQGSVKMQDVCLIQNLPDEKIFVQGHDDRLQQVMSNLLSNAIKFTPEGGRIEVSANKISGDGKTDEVKVSFADTGKGIPKELQQVIFDKFQQADKENRDKSEGSGLGLALVREIIEHHGGRVGLESEPGRGSIFYFILQTRNQEDKSEKNINRG